MISKAERLRVARSRFATYEQNRSVGLPESISIKAGSCRCNVAGGLAVWWGSRSVLNSMVRLDAFHRSTLTAGEVRDPLLSSGKVLS